MRSRGSHRHTRGGKKGGRRVLNVPIAGRDAVGDSWRSSSRSETSNTLVTVAAVFIREALAREKFELGFGFGLGLGFGFGFGLRCRRCKAFSGHILDHIAFSLRACTCDEMSVMKAWCAFAVHISHTRESGDGVSVYGKKSENCLRKEEDEAAYGGRVSS